MLKKLFLFSILLFSVSLFASPIHQEQFATAKEQFERRWEAFAENNDFIPFEAGKSDAVLKEEFAKILATREFMWTTPGYEFAEHLISGDLIRAPGCIAFDYNNTVSNYNATTIYLGGKYYIACEGPRSKDIPSFFQMLRNYHVSHLVRLTDSYEGESKKCHPYWEGKLAEAPQGDYYLNVPAKCEIYPVRAFDMAHWKDNCGVDPHDLLSVVLRVRQDLSVPDSLLAVHCSAGVGRTGTFFAALAVVDAIDLGAPFSIEEIVYRLSLQRIHSVSKESQYITLHRLAEAYMNQKNGCLEEAM